MSTISYIYTKVSDPFARYMGYGELQDHTFPFWTGSHSKAVVNSTTTKTQTSYTPQEGDELCVEGSNGGGSYLWNGQIKIDGTAISSVVAITSSNPLIMYYKYGQWHEFSGQSYTSNYSAWKDGIDNPSRPAPPETRPIYLNHLHQRKLFYDPEDYQVQKLLKTHLRRLFF